MLQAQINGKPLRMIVDTGSEFTVLFRDGARALGLSLRPLTDVDFYGATGQSHVMETNVSELKVASLVARNVNLAVSGRSDSDGAQGLLGSYFLLQSDVEFDLAAKKLRFFTAKGCTGDQVVYWGKAYSVTPMLGSSDEKKIRVTVRVNGNPVEAEMDTGAGASIISTTVAERAGVKTTSASVVANEDTRGIGGQRISTYVGVFPSFAFGDEVIKNARLRIADIFSANKEIRVGSHLPIAVGNQPEMLLGADFFRSHRIYVAMSQRKVYISYVGGPVFQAPPSATPSPGK